MVFRDKVKNGPTKRPIIEESNWIATVRSIFDLGA
jgi:hypothetical protein